MDEMYKNGYTYAQKLEKYLQKLGKKAIQNGFENLLNDKSLKEIVTNAILLEAYGFDITECGILKRILKNTVSKCSEDVNRNFAESVSEMNTKLSDVSIEIGSLKNGLTKLTNEMVRATKMQEKFKKVKGLMSRFLHENSNCDAIQYNNKLSQTAPSEGLSDENKVNEILSEFLEGRNTECLNELKITLNSNNVCPEFYSILENSQQKLGIDVFEIARSPEQLCVGQQKLKLINVLLDGSSGIQHQELKESLKNINDLQNTPEMAKKLDELLENISKLEKKVIMSRVNDLKKYPPIRERKTEKVRRPLPLSSGNDSLIPYGNRGLLKKKSNLITIPKIKKQSPLTLRGASKSTLNRSKYANMK